MAQETDQTSPRFVSRARSFAWRVVRIYILVLLAMMLLERSMVFHPARYPSGDWSPTHLEVEDVFFTSSDGTKLHGWYCEHPQPRAIVLYCHGNAGNLSHRAERLRELLSLNVSVLIFDYRGYGRSEGTPHEAGILADARAARSWLAERTGRDAREIVLLGRSLGSGVAVNLAVEDGAKGLILENAFTSLPEVAADHFPFLPTQWIMRTRLDSLAQIARYRGRLLQCHGTDDEVVSYRFGEKLFEAASEPKEFLAIPGGMHNDPSSRAYMIALDRFFESLE